MTGNCDLASDIGVLRRAPDWPSRLEQYLSAARARAFAWGINDCCLFACGAIEAMTGVNPGAWFLNRYRSAFAARWALKAFAGGGLAETVEKLAALHARPEIAPLRAQRGDLCLAGSHDGLSGLGICLGSRAAFMTPRGLVFVPMGRVARCWRI